MCDLNFKIKEMEKLVDSLEPGTVRNEMHSVLDDMRLLQQSELQAETSWECAMMALVGTDGIGGVKRVVIKMIEALEAIKAMPDGTSITMASHKAANVLELIDGEKRLARG